VGVGDIKVDAYIRRKLSKDGSLHFALLDPDDVDLAEIPDIVLKIKEAGSDAIMVGGSTVVDQRKLYDVISVIRKNVTLPVILFPNNLTGVTSNAHAIWFMSLFNSTNPYFITGAQMLAAPYIKKSGLEVLSLAYLIIGEGKTAGFIGNANPIPFDKPEIAVGYAIAAELMGFKYVYLESGSGAKKTIPTRFVSYVKRYLNKTILLVGGGIRKGDIAYKLAKAGADIIVTGNVILNNIDNLVSIVEGVKKGGKERVRYLQE